MADLINLRQARKNRARAEKEAAAKASRAAHGRTKAEKSSAAAYKEKADKDLTGHLRDPK
ncbi:MAG TPA: DUF4169 family protein [Caulobacterales bacterium]|jgi:hypothetical protein|nr:DUF4169 family protein [Caulobacterales bacterium]